jgi:hypothetical protein
VTAISRSTDKLDIFVATFYMSQPQGGGHLSVYRGMGAGP